MAGWLYTVDENGLRVAPEFYEELRKRRVGAQRKLAETDLTARYRERYSALSRWQADHIMQPLLFPDADPVPDHERMPDHKLVPFIRGRDSPPAWLPIKVIYKGERDSSETKRFLRWLKSSVDPTLREPTLKRSFRRVSKDGEPEVIVGGPPVPMFPGYSVKYKGDSVEIAIMKPNPKFDLVLVNKHDRAALLNLLSALEPAGNVERWIDATMSRSGAMAPSQLYAAYAAWCASTGEPPAGSKGFSQKLVAAGVAKLTRGGSGEKYQLEPKKRR